MAVRSRNWLSQHNHSTRRTNVRPHVIGQKKGRPRAVTLGGSFTPSRKGEDDDGDHTAVPANSRLTTSQWPSRSDPRPDPGPGCLRPPPEREHRGGLCFHSAWSGAIRGLATSRTGWSWTTGATSAPRCRRGASTNPSDGPSGAQRGTERTSGPRRSQNRRVDGLDGDGALGPGKST